MSLGTQRGYFLLQFTSAKRILKSAGKKQFHYRKINPRKIAELHEIVNAIHHRTI